MGADAEHAALGDLRRSDPWVAALPGVMIFATSMAFNLLADGVRAALDIRR